MICANDVHSGKSEWEIMNTDEGINIPFNNEHFSKDLSPISFWKRGIAR